MQPKLNALPGPAAVGSYARGPAAGVDYFSDTGRQIGLGNLNPGQSALNADAEAPDAGFRQLLPDTGFSTGESSRDLGDPNAPSAGAMSPGTLSSIGQGVSVLGQVTGSPELGMAGGFTSAAAQAQMGNYGPIGGFAGGLVAGAPGAAIGSLAGQAFGGTMTPTSVGQTLGGYFGGLPGSVLGGLVGGGLFGMNSTMSEMGVPEKGYAGLFGTDLGRQLGQEAFVNPTTSTNLGKVDGIGLGPSSTGGSYGGWGGGQLGQANVGTSMGGGQGVTVGPSGGFSLGTTISGLGLSAPSGWGTSFGTGGFSDTGSDGGGNSTGMGGSGNSSAGAGGFGGMGHAEGLADGGLVGLPERYADGGMVGSGAPLLATGFAEGGMVPMGAAGMSGMGGQPNSAQVMQQVNQLLRNPQMKQRLVGRAQQLMAAGELTPDEVMTMARVAEAAMFNPQLYPQLRQFVAEQGLSPLPPGYDPSVIVRIMAIAKALQEAQPATPPGQVPPTQQASMEPPVPGMANGGYLRGPGNGRSDSIGTVNESSGQPVKVANGEYVIPEHVVRAKGRDFFDNLLRRYADVPKE